MTKRLSFLLCFLPFLLSAQQATNLYLLQVKTYDDGTKLLEKPLLLTGFNKENENSQPFIKANGNILFTAFFNGQSDIIEINPKAEKVENLTKSPERESYGQVFGGDLWFNKAGNIYKGGDLQIQAKDAAHFFVSPKRIYYSTTVSTLQKTSLSGSGTSQILDNLCGPAVYLTSDEKLLVAQKYARGFKYLRGMGPEGGEIILNKNLEGRGNLFTVDDKDDLWMASGAKVYHLSKPYTSNWVEVADFTKLQLTKITELAVRGSQVVITAGK